jgi:SAM-dependent methyltransferase
MREATAELLRCPRCRTDRTLSLKARETDEREVRTGTLTCSACSAEFDVSDGIMHLLHDPPDFVVREAAGLERFAETMRADGWDKARILKLPDEHQGYWYGQSLGMQHVLDRANFQPGQRLVDVGSNTCWASNIFARRGLDVIALDIATAPMQGLKTADWFIETGEVFFERMLSVMYDPALASESVDYVFCCEVLHHNDVDNLNRTLEELYRVLKPGGTLFIVNEPLRFPLMLKRDHAEEVAEYEGNEHVFFFHQYLRAVRRAGFEVERPWTPPGEWPASDTSRRARAARALDRIPGTRLLREARIAGRWSWRYVIRGGTRALTLDCTKPAEG